MKSHYPTGGLKKTLLLLISLLISISSMSQHSIARAWNDVLLDAIRRDLARPTVHARNLFHSSVMMYDAWALFDPVAEPVFLGKTFGTYFCPFDGIKQPSELDSAREEVLSYAMFRLLNHRFRESPGAWLSIPEFADLFQSLGYDDEFTSVAYQGGSYAALGNYLAEQMIAFGMQDGSNEPAGYGNMYYSPVNEPLILREYADTISIDPNRWQPLSFESFIDQGGNAIPVAIPPFLGPEWGSLVPFSLDPDKLTVVNNGFDSYLYFDPGPPVYIQNSMGNGIADDYKWNFALVVAWSSHLDPNDSTLIDISPGALGNLTLESLPRSLEAYREFYDFANGGDIGTGHSLNPVTNLPYAPQWVKRSDYTRVLAEFWADGPDSETPPGHWFTILNYVSDHPLLQKRWQGEGPVLDDLEWDVKTYLTLGGAMHDSAIATWAIKGYYDYIRPISAIRYMSSKGQSSDPSLPGFHPHGLPLMNGLIELIGEGDPLAGENGENIGKVKVRAWRGPDYIANPITDVAGVDWIPGTHWWPYQRGTFVTPPFAGYVSGHSTFSRAAAEVLTLVTGDKFFPGGMGTFEVKKNEFLFFEAGPSEDFALQWATYYDASDQTSLSRIWGGIHPPIDDIRGRLIGNDIGNLAFNTVQVYFTGERSDPPEAIQAEFNFYPLPARGEVNLQSNQPAPIVLRLYGLDGRLALKHHMEDTSLDLHSVINLSALAPGVYLATFQAGDNRILARKKIVKL